MASKQIMITGANGGIGKEIAKSLAAAGHTIIALARNQQRLQALAGEIGCTTISADLTVKEEIEKIATYLNNHNQRINALIHCAGIARVAKIGDMSWEAWQQVLAINLNAPFYLSRVLLPYIKQPGHLIFVNSTAGLDTFPEWGAYCASKYALRALADTLRKELKESSIKVTSVYPASTDTGMHEDLPYNWNRKKMLKAENVARAVAYCIEQSEHVSVNSIDLEHVTGTF
jgi:NADP-dependent 3-hydroxy acid dehydrogenase YdfG